MQKVQSIPQQLSPVLVMEATPERLLDIRSKHPQTGSSPEVLIKWLDLPLYEATWEEYDNIQLRFPEFHIGFKVAVLALGIATPSQSTSANVLTYSRKELKGRIVSTVKRQG